MSATNTSPDTKTETHDDELQKVADELNVKFEKWFCSSCGRFLLDYAILEGTIVRKCRRCKRMNVLDIHGVELVES
jgi:phage FluMu protein Com